VSVRSAALCQGFDRPDSLEWLATRCDVQSGSEHHDERRHLVGNHIAAAVARRQGTSRSFARGDIHVAIVTSMPKHSEMLCAAGQLLASTSCARCSTSGLQAPISASHSVTVAASSLAGM
jgi:hypothetical protein